MYGIRHGYGFNIGRRLWAAAVAASILPLNVTAEGPDVIVGVLDQVNDYNRSSDITAFAMTTISCNAGDRPLDWYALPSNRHPVIAQNMYRLADGRMEQIGQAWVKHGFAALQENHCFSNCRPTSFTQLGVHCSDPYTEGLNRGPNLGPRSAINPVDGYFDSSANNHAGHVHTGISHGLQVPHVALANPGARYFVEAHYVAPDDAVAGNGNNNASYREVAITGGSGNWTITNVGFTVREVPALFAWPGASFVIIDSWPEDGRIIVAYKVNDAGPGFYRYDYAVYNMNSDRGIRSFSVPLGEGKPLTSFHAVRSHDEPAFHNVPWPTTEMNGQVQWATSAFSPTGRSNPIRWGTMYNFSIETDQPPVPAIATLERFKPGLGTSVLHARVLAPAASDCNRNGIRDDWDIRDGYSLDVNRDGIPDECVPCARDVGCGASDRCTERSCESGWCVARELLYGDPNADGTLDESDIECVLGVFSGDGECPGADLYPCQADHTVNFMDVLAAIEVQENQPPCCTR
jgi:hypothetical protein